MHVDDGRGGGGVLLMVGGLHLSGVSVVDYIALPISLLSRD